MKNFSEMETLNTGKKAVTTKPFFNIQRKASGWTLVDPDGKPFFSLGLNHAEEADLKHPNNYKIWETKYGSRSQWMTNGVVSDLNEYNFNTLGWTQQWVAGDYINDPWTEPVDLRHSQGWSPAELASSGLPYVQAIRFAEIEDWNANPGFPDVFSSEFEQYCDHQARVICDIHKDDPNLVGYFFVDVPSWLPHQKVDRYFNTPDASSDAELYRIASKYYEVTTAAVRKYDPNHLILGDRYNGNRGIPKSVLAAAKPFIDVLSVQYFPGHGHDDLERMRDDLRSWAEFIDKPVIIADIGNNTGTAYHAARPDGLPDHSARAAHYVAALGAVIDEPWLVGWHWCGYVENPVRGWGLKSPQDEPYYDMTERISTFNGSVLSRSAQRHS